MHARIGGILATLAVCLAPALAFAQVIPPSEQPGRARERFVEPPPPQAQPGGPTVVLPSTEAPAGAAQIVVTIRDVCVRGSTIYGKNDFAPLYADLVGRSVPLQAIYDLAKKITAKYGNDGYSLSRAIVPPQEFSPKGAVPCLQIVEGYVERVEWPASVTAYRDFFTHYAAMITAQRPVNVKTIERYMLLAGDLPGLKFSASLKPSPRATGASVLVVEVAEKRFDALGRIDNRGTEARGPVQYQVSGNINNVLRMHESLNLTYAAATQNEELQYYAAGYRQVLTAEGLWWFVNASHGPSRPGTQELVVLDYKTLSTIVESGIAAPVIRSREANLTLSGLVFASESTSDMLEGLFQTVDRLRGIRLKADADFADRLLAINQINVILSQGIDGLGSTGNDNPMPSRPGKVDFTKIELTLSRTQPLPARFSAFGSVYGQYAGTSLLSPEQCGYGGRYYGRAYDPSELLGDHCVAAIGELRYDVPGLPEPVGQLQFYGFGDWGKRWLRDPAPGSEPELSAASAGGGVRAAWLTNAFVDLSVAKAVAGPRDDTRFFFTVTGRY
jgi:hemolysin activation/secretion protein